MAAQAGKDFLIKIGDGGGPETFTTVGGLRASTMTINAEAIDVTNQGSSQWKTLLDGAGIKHLSLSGSGVFDNSSNFTTLRTKFLNQNLWNFQLSDGVNTYTAAFKITKLERQGDYKNEQSYSISMESSGPVTIA